MSVKFVATKLKGKTTADKVICLMDLSVPELVKTGKSVFSAYSKFIWHNESLNFNIKYFKTVNMSLKI